jgi:hypothetical protein
MRWIISQCNCTGQREASPSPHLEINANEA